MYHVWIPPATAYLHVPKAMFCSFPMSSCQADNCIHASQNPTAHHVKNCFPSEGLVLLSFWMPLLLSIQFGCSLVFVTPFLSVPQFLAQMMSSIPWSVKGNGSEVTLASALSFGDAESHNAHTDESPPFISQPVPCKALHVVVLPCCALSCTLSCLQRYPGLFPKSVLRTLIISPLSIPAQFQQDVTVAALFAALLSGLTVRPLITPQTQPPARRKISQDSWNESHED